MNKKYKDIKIGFLLAVAGVITIVAACGSGAPDTPAPTASSTSGFGVTWGAPTLAFDKMHVDLGTVTRDQLGIQTFLAMNRGEGPLELGPVEIQAEQGCDIAETPGGVLRLQMGEMALLPIKIGRHKDLGPHQLLVSVSSNDPATPIATLTIAFDVVEAPPPPGPGPRLRVDKDTVAIGDVPSDWPLYERFTLRNEGDSPLIMEGIPLLRVEEGC